MRQTKGDSNLKRLSTLSHTSLVSDWLAGKCLSFLSSLETF